MTASTPHRRWRVVHSECSTGWGGQEHRILAELVGFHNRGNQTWLVAPTDSQIFSRARERGIAVHPLSASRWRFPFMVVGMARWLRQAGAEVLNTHSSRDGWLMGLAGRLARVPLIIRTRHIDVAYPWPWLSRHAFATLADHVMVTSEKIAANLRHIFQLAPDGLSMIPTGIDLALFSPEGPVVRLVPEDPQKPLRPVVGMISVLRSWKGHETFLEAARLLKAGGFPAAFAIVGDGPIRPVVERLKREKGLEAEVVLAGHREDVPAVLRGLDALVIASTRHEGIPQIGLQALATKTPVIGSDIGGTPEIIRAGETGRVFPAGNAAALAGAIRETLENAGDTRVMSERGRALVEAGHSLETMLDRVEAVYRKYLSA